MTDVGRDLTDIEVRYLRLLFDVRQRAYNQGHLWDAQLEDLVLELRESGATVRGIAELLDVGASTVQSWTKNARQRRRQKS